MLAGEGSGLPGAAATAALAEAKAYLRAGHAGEDALIAALTASAAELCQAFCGRVLLAQPLAEILPVGGAWIRLSRRPVRSIEGVDVMAADGAASPLPVASYRIDIDPRGDGWVRIVAAPAEKRVRVRYVAGLAQDWEGLPQSLRQGIVRLAAHLYAERDGDRAASPPAAVTALWRPWRLIPFSGLGGFHA